MRLSSQSGGPRTQTLKMPSHLWGVCESKRGGTSVSVAGGEGLAGNRQCCAAPASLRSVVDPGQQALGTLPPNGDPRCQGAPVFRLHLARPLSAAIPGPGTIFHLCQGTRRAQGHAGGVWLYCRGMRETLLLVPSTCTPRRDPSTAPFLCSPWHPPCTGCLFVCHLYSWLEGSGGCIPISVLASRPFQPLTGPEGAWAESAVMGDSQGGSGGAFPILSKGNGGGLAGEGLPVSELSSALRVGLAEHCVAGQHRGLPLAPSCLLGLPWKQLGGSCV